MRQSEALWSDLVAHSDPCQEQQDAAKAWRMRLGRACKLIGLARSAGQQVGNAELGHDVDRLRDPIPPNEGEKLCSGLDRSVHQTRRSLGCARRSPMDMSTAASH